MLGYLKEFLRKKLICAKNMTKLPALTVCAQKFPTYAMDALKMSTYAKEALNFLRMLNFRLKAII